MPVIQDPLSRQVIGAAIKVHRTLGPGLFERVYHQCLAYELAKGDIPFVSNVPMSLLYDDQRVGCAYRADFVISGELLLELKSVDRLIPVHDAQVLTYLRIARLPHGLLINFNVTRLVDGLKSFLMT